MLNMNKSSVSCMGLLLGKASGIKLKPLTVSKKLLQALIVENISYW